MKKSIVLFFMAFMAIASNAQDPVLVDGLWFKVDPWDENAATVVANPNNEGYSGNVVIPNEVTINGVVRKVTTIGYRAFCGSKILSVVVGKNVTRIEDHAFSYSTVGSAIIGGDLEEGESSCWMGDYTFYACENLTDVVIGNNVYALGDQTFQNCSNLKSVVLGKRVGSIYVSSFADCKSLKDIYCLGEYAPWQESGRIFAEGQANDMTLHVPEAYAANYNRAPWSEFKEVQTMKSTEMEKCAKPEIIYDNGSVSFTCATEGVEYNSSVEYVENEFNNVSEYPAPSHFRVRVVAVKNGFLPSDVAEQEFTLPGYVDVKTGEYKEGDVNKDGNVNVADHVRLSSIILDQTK